MSPADELRAAAKKLREDGPYGDMDEPLAIWLDHEANWADYFLASEHARAVAYVINGGTS